MCPVCASSDSRVSCAYERRETEASAGRAGLPLRDQLIVRLVLLGTPGSGKGTEDVAIAEHFDALHVPSGDLLRMHVADPTELGLEVAGYATKRRARTRRSRAESDAENVLVRFLVAPVEIVRGLRVPELSRADGTRGLDQGGGEPARPKRATAPARARHRARPSR
jgi:hypothetical protein